MIFFNILRKSYYLYLPVVLTTIVLIASVIGSSTIVSIDPVNQTIGGDDDFSISIYCVPSQPIKAYELKLSFDSSLVQAVEVTEGDIFDGYTTFFNSGTINNVVGTIIDIYGLILGSGNVSLPGTLVNINFTGESNGGTSPIALYDVGVTNETVYIPISLVNGTVFVDVIPPVIVDNSPSQGYTGDSYTFNVSVTDNSNDTDDLIVKVDWSHGGDGGNETMINVGGDYFEKTVMLNLYSVLDMSYTFYAVDIYDNSFTTSLSSVSIIDNDLPVISDVYAIPNSQEIFGFVNISSDIVDNIAINNVFAHVTYPDSSWEYFSITGNKSGDIYYCNKSYDMLGLYSYYFWAEDLEGNSVTSSVDNFNIGDITAPVISNVVITTSEPVDTDPLFGWVKISCDVTDNVAVDEVFVNISNPDGSWNNVSLNSGGGNSFIVNSSVLFSEFGNYSYYLWAIDSSDNNVDSSSFYLSIAPNWDIDNDGIVNVVDLILVSNHYDETSDPGWIREDVDNNGEVLVFDLVLVSNHYGEMWWEA
jgi:hypothetical protein